MGEGVVGQCSRQDRIRKGIRFNIFCLILSQLCSMNNEML